MPPQCDPHPDATESELFHGIIAAATRTSGARGVLRQLVGIDEANRVQKMVRIVEYLSGPSTLLLEWTELADRLQILAGWLERDRAHLIRTGYPEHRYPVGRAIADSLENLYPVRIPLYVGADTGSPPRLSYLWPHQVPPGSILPVELAPVRTHKPPMEPDRISISDSSTSDHIARGFQTWLRHANKGEWREPPAGLHTDRPSGRFLMLDGTEILGRRYEEAALHPDYSDQDTLRLESLREPLLEAKIRILQHCADALLSDRKGELWEDCGSILLAQQAISTADLCFLLDVERLVLGRDLLRPDVAPAESWVPAGGLSAMADLVGHVEAELRVASFHRACVRLGGFVDGLRGGSGTAFRHYASVRSSPALWDKLIERAKAARDSADQLDEQESCCKRVRDLETARVAASAKCDEIESILVDWTETDRDANTYFRQVHERVRIWADRIFMGQQSTERQPPQTASNSSLRHDAPKFQRLSRTWRITYGDHSIERSDTIGWFYVQHLVRRPEQWVTATDLEAAADADPRLRERRQRGPSVDPPDSEKARLRVRDAIKKAVRGVRDKHCGLYRHLDKALIARKSCIYQP